MQYHASDRPRGANGLPLYRTPAGWLAAIPQMAISPLATGGFRVGVMLLVAPGSAQWHHAEVHELAPLMDAWGADPEATMEETFQWKWRGAPRGLSLDELLS